ncbi:hypothetical protein QOT17_001098 [Balamuthia mandrillaris]
MGRRAEEEDSNKLLGVVMAIVFLLPFLYLLGMNSMKQVVSEDAEPSVSSHAESTKAQLPPWPVAGVATTMTAGPPGICHVKGRPNFKTATTSTGLVLETLGFRDMGWDYPFYLKWEAVLTHASQLVRHFPLDQIPPHVERHVRTICKEFRAALDDKDSFSDFPLGHPGHKREDGVYAGVDIRVKNILWPDARYIWLEREPTEWRKSWSYWQTMHPTGYTLHMTDEEMIRWYEEMRNEVLELSRIAPERVLMMPVTAGQRPIFRLLFGDVECANVDKPMIHNKPA